MCSNQPTFYWKTDCFFCDEKVCFDSEHPKRHPQSRRVGGKEKSVLLIDRIQKKFDERNDTFASDVQKRLSIYGDLLASEIVYHSHCHARFFFNKPIDAGKSPGRPQCLKMQATFNEICSWLENETE